MNNLFLHDRLDGTTVIFVSLRSEEEKVEIEIAVGVEDDRTPNGGWLSRF